MKPLTIELVKGQKQEFTFLGWKDDGLAFYATGEDDHQPAVITPVSAYPDDANSGEPYRFPTIDPTEIIPKQFEIAWSDHHRDVLKRWRETKLAEVDAEIQRTISFFDALKAAAMVDEKRPPQAPRTLAEINGRRRDYREFIEINFKTLIETPLTELFDPIAYPGALDDFRGGKWGDAMGEDFGVMINEAGWFNARWHDAYDGRGDHRNYQSMLSAMRRVRLVMRGDDKKVYPLTGVEVRRPTDLEAQAYAVMKGASALPQGQSKSAEPKARATKVRAIDKPKRRARFENDFSLAVIPQRKGEPLRITIEPELRSLLNQIIAAGGNIPRTKLREGKSDTYQPEKLLRSQTAQALVEAGLLGSQLNGRTTVFWAKIRAD